MTIGDLFLRVLADDKGFEADLVKKSSATGDKAGKTLGARMASGLKTSLVTIGKVLAVGIAAIVGGGAIVGKELLELGTRLEQMDAKAKTVFGDQKSLVDKWAKANANAMGLTSREATGLAANFADLLIPMKFTREQAAKMSTDVVGLSGALSQWSGGTRSAAEVSEILAKAMLGERDSLKELGISILDADVKARLLKKGQQDLTGAALEQAKAIATQELIFEKSADAQAAFAEGSDKLIGRQQAAKAKLRELVDTLAVGLLPVFHTVVSFIADKVVPAVGQIVGKIQKWFTENKVLVSQIIAFVGGTLKNFVAAIGNVISWIAMLIGKITSNRDAMNVLRTTAALLGTAFGVVVTVIGTVVGAIGGFIDALTKNKFVVDVFKSAIGGVVANFKLVRDAIGFVIAKISSLIAWVKDAITWLNKLGVIQARNVGQTANPYDQRASGGPVSGGQTYLVGERGPELFRPSSSGTIIPRVPADWQTPGASADRTYNISVTNPEPRAADTDIGRMLRRLETLGIG
jgi:hypothetical protein